ncbi:MAG: putative ammonium transporter [Methanosaeta sp. PtaB.Bin018]|nr:ammonium transporter [Methanothrix sp.]OPX76102.1 MAG: putative ammonium transporter [Methanosaeta sp. PtaB.Bin018]OPY43264.1 MAG: putative ammonium transporter [Methanosaeta sp. PtaU1.Bin016]
MRAICSLLSLAMLIGEASADDGPINAADNAWVLISAALVLIMIPGVGLFYGGMVRKKNAISTIIFSFAIMGIISLQWILYGYTLAFGKDISGLIGSLDFLGLDGVGMGVKEGLTIPALTFMIFQAMFAIITVSLITGSYVERIKFSSFLVFSLVWATLVYDPIAHWVWGGGWLQQLGALDFAGGIVVHISAGVSALAIAMVIGARKGFGTDPMEPHNIPTTVIGAALLWFGWFGFNAGSALAANGLAANAFVTTNTSAAAAATTWMLLSWRQRAPSALGIVTGAVAGLAAITPAAGFVTPLAAVPIGVVAAFAGYYAILLVRGSKKVDDSLDVLACHGIGSTWGVLATGIFASIGAAGLLAGNYHQVVVQLIAIAVTWVYSFVVTLGIAKAIDSVMGLRVRDEEEAVGLDISQHGEGAYM